MSELEVLAKQIEANQRWLVDRLDEICRLIEHGPEVNRRFVGRWAILFRQDEISVNKTGHHLDWEKYIEHLLCEAGVTVRGAK